MKACSSSRLTRACAILALFFGAHGFLHAADPLTLKQVVDLALAHSTASAASGADQQRAFASLHEARNQYLPQFLLGSGLGASWGYPLSLEGAAPSLVNLTAQSALINPALRDFIRAARADYQASAAQSKDQRNQVIQDTAIAYAELTKWRNLSTYLHQQFEDAGKAEQAAAQRVQEGVDNPTLKTKARLNTARLRLRLTQANGSIDVLKRHLSQLTGLATAAFDNMDAPPALPEVRQEEDLSAKAMAASPGAEAAQIRATAYSLRARGEHRSMLPSVDFAAQYALLATYNNYDKFFQPNSFQRHNATLGVAIRFPFLNPAQHAHAQAADAEAVKAKSDAIAARNQVSEETLRLQRSVEQLSAAQQVAELESQLAQTNLESLQIRLNSGSGAFADVADAQQQVNERYLSLQDMKFELEKSRIMLLRATGELENWVGK
jgi:outer membrane protein